MDGTSDAAVAGVARLRLLGLGLAVLAALFASSAGVLLRQLESADAWTVLVYRSLGFVLVVLAVIAVRHGREAAGSFTRIGRSGLWVAVTLGGAFVAFVLALMQAKVATVAALLGVSPLAAGLIGWLVVGERPSGAAWLAMALAALGVSVIVWDRLEAGSLQGLALAGLACLGYAAAMVGLRAGRAADMTPAICLSGILAGGVSLLAAESLAAPPGDIAMGLALGVLQIGLQYILLTIAARFAPAAELALVMILELVLAPLWVWLFVGEAVPPLVLCGGSIVLAALVFNAVAAGAAPGVRRAPAPTTVTE